MTRQKTLTTTVSAVTHETYNVATVRMDLGGQTFDYKPGQAVNIDPNQFAALADLIQLHEAKTGQPVMPRAFSLSSNPLEKGFIEITVKEEENHDLPPLLSPYFVHRLKEGEKITIMGPFGLYTLPDAPDPAVTGFIHICAGSGVAPNRGIMKYALSKGLPQKHVLFYQNRTPNDIIFRREWGQLERHYAGQVKIVHVISRPQAGKEKWYGRTGYVNEDLIRAELEGMFDLAGAMAFVCGPNRPRDGGPGFLDKYAGNKRKNQIGLLGRLGLPFERIRTEMW